MSVVRFSRPRSTLSEWEVVRVRMVRPGAHNRTGALLDRETGPDLTWQWGVRRVFQKREYEIEFN